MEPGYDMQTSLKDYEHEPRVVDTFVVLDLDRTMLDTGRLVDAMCMLLARHGLSDSEAQAESAYIHTKEGGSFQVSEYLVEKYGVAIFIGIKQELLALAGLGELDELLYSGVPELLDALDEREIPFGVLTYGEDENQNFKIQLLRAITKRDDTSLPAEVTQVKLKSESIHADWQHDDVDGFDVSEKFTHGRPIHATYIVIVDDKTQHLETDNQNIRGFLVNNGAKDKAGQPIVEFLALVQSLEPDESLWLAAA